MNPSCFPAIVVAAFAAASFHASAFAAPVKFNPPAVIFGEADVSTTGKLVQAVNFGGDEQTVNGVKFEAGKIGSGQPRVEFDAVAVEASSDSIIALNDSPTFAGEGAPFDSYPAAYKALLGSGAYANKTSGTLTLTLSGLTKGKSYTVQFFVNDSRDFHGGNRHETISSGGAESDPLDYSSTRQLGGVGQVLTATFTADGASQEFVFKPVNSQTDDAQINAFQLRTTP